MTTGIMFNLLYLKKKKKRISKHQKASDKQTQIKKIKKKLKAKQNKTKNKYKSKVD